MPNVSGTGTIWNLPNYAGALFTADLIHTPFLNMVGGLSGGFLTENFEFVIDSEYSHESAAQPAITETDSLTAPTAVEYVRSQNTNVTQIFQRQVALSYEKLSNGGRLTGLNTVGNVNNAPSELDFQIARHLEALARDVEYTCLNGVYQKATDAGTANKTRGMIAACTTNTVDASAAVLSKDLIDELLLEMHNNGAYFGNMVIWGNGRQIPLLGDIYGYAPESRTIGGINIKQIVTPFGNIGVAYPHRFMPTDTLLFADMGVIGLAFQPVPGKGNLFYEPLAKTGAAETGQLYGKIGLAHGPAFMHGTLTNLYDS